MDIIEKLAEIFKEFPGIGERQAKRFVYFLMSRTPAYNENLSGLILDFKKEKLCDICSNVNADSSTLLVVEKDSDLESVKKSRMYHGKYFILGGLVPIVEKTTKSRIRIEELKQKISGSKEPNKLSEIILAFSLSPQGDHTDQYVREQIKDVSEKQTVKISSLGRGLSTGTELEYSDNDTLKNALKNRQ